MIQLLTPLVEQELPLSSGGDNALADLLLELGNAHHALGQDDLALQRWQQGTQGAEGDKRLFMGLNISQVLCGRKRFEEAAAICNSLEPLFPRNANLAYAQRVISRGRPTKAMQYLSSVDPNPVYRFAKHLRPIAARYRAHPQSAALLRRSAQT